jgi:hypothetical protein
MAHKAGHDEGDLEPRLAIRRHTDRCFHRVEEVVKGKHGGYIVQGVLIPEEDVAETVELDGEGNPACRVRVRDKVEGTRDKAEKSEMSEG